MSRPGQNRAEVEYEALRRALETETLRSIGLERRLDRANAEFEEFVSMAAHNLRESLRDVASYGQLLAGTHAGRLDPDAAEFLDRIRDEAARAQSLVAAMVDYWATDTGGRQATRTDMAAVLCQAILCTDKQIAGRSALVTHDPLPAVMGDFELLTKVLHHLLRNAIGYCDTHSPRIHVSARRVDLDWVFSVRDNGPGIDPAFQDRIFGPFKRLHGREHPGDGLGLAFCRKVIDWHGGRIWIESTPGAGSTFLFTLPPAET